MTLKEVLKISIFIFSGIPLSLNAGVFGDFGASSALNFSTILGKGVLSEVSAQLFGVPDTVSEKRSIEVLGQLDEVSDIVDDIRNSINDVGARVGKIKCHVRGQNLNNSLASIQSAGQEYKNFLVATGNSKIGNTISGEDFIAQADKVKSDLFNFRTVLLDRNLVADCGKMFGEQYSQETVGDSHYYHAYNEWLRYFTIAQTMGTFYAVTASKMDIADSRSYSEWLYSQPNPSESTVTSYCKSKHVSKENEEDCFDISSFKKRLEEDLIEEYLAVGFGYSQYGLTRVQITPGKKEVLIWPDDLYVYDPCSGRYPEIKFFSILKKGKQCGATFGFPTVPLKKTYFAGSDGWRNATMVDLNKLIDQLPSAKSGRAYSADMNKLENRGRIGDRMIENGFGKSFQRTIIYADVSKGLDYNKRKCSGKGDKDCMYPFVDTWLPKIQTYGTIKSKLFSSKKTKTETKIEVSQTVFDQVSSRTILAVHYRRGWVYSDVLMGGMYQVGPITNFFSRPGFYIEAEEADTGEGDTDRHSPQRPKYANRQLDTSLPLDGAMPSDTIWPAFRLPVLEKELPDCSKGKYADHKFGKGKNSLGVDALCGEPLEAVMEHLLRPDENFDLSVIRMNG